MNKESKESKEREKSNVIVSNLVNFSNLEKVFCQIFEKLDKIDNRLQACENEISKKVSLSRFLSLQHEYESHILLFESRLKDLEQSMSVLTQLSEKTNVIERETKKIMESNLSFLTKENYENSILNFENSINSKIDKIENEKCNLSYFQKLEESQYDICSQLSAMESMLQCKLDRSQLPLLNNINKQFESLLSFRDNISKRVCIMDDQLYDINNIINNKLTDNDTIVSMENELLTKLNSKCDESFVSNEIMTKLNRLGNDVLTLLQEHKQVSMTQCFNQINKLSKQYHESNKDSMNQMSEMKNHLLSIEKQLYNVPSLQQFDKKADRCYIEQLTDECKSFCANNNTIYEKESQKMVKQIENLNNLSNKMQQQLSLVLRFVDWYSNVQLNK